MELNKVLDRVRKLVALAEHEGTPAHEAAAAREQADRLMLEYAIEGAQLDATRPASERAKPGVLVMPVGPQSDITAWLATLAGHVARHCRCKIRFYDQYTDGEWHSKVYGFESDLHYFEVLYTTIQLHMLGVLAPSVDSALSEDENAYRLHNAGHNWLDIAGMYGWRKTYREAGDTQAMYLHRETGERRSNWQLGSHFKRAYYRAIKARGETPTKISAGGAATYRESAAQGYVSRMSRRLYDASSGRAPSGELVLANRMSDLEDFWRESNDQMYVRCLRCEKLSSNPYECEFCGQFIKDRPGPCPRCEASKSGYCRQHPKGSFRDTPFNASAYQRGVEHADTADLGTNARMGTTRKEISQDSSAER